MTPRENARIWAYLITFSTIVMAATAAALHIAGVA